MCRMDVIVHDDHRDDVINCLHSLGVSQIQFLGEGSIKDYGIERNTPSNRAAKIANYFIRVNRMIASLQHFDKKKIPFIEGMMGIEKIERADTKDMDYGKIIESSENLLARFEQRVTDLTEDVERLSSSGSALYKNLSECNLCLAGINVSHLGTGKYLYTAAGIIETDDESAAAVFEKEIRQVAGSDMIFNFSFISESGVKGAEKFIKFVLSTPVKFKDEINAVFVKNGVRVLSIEGEGMVEEIIRDIKKKLDEIADNKERINSELIKIYEKFYNDLLVHRELLDIERIRSESFIYGGRTKTTSFLRFWIPTCEVESTGEKIKNITRECHINVEKNLDNIKDKSEIPIILNNQGYVKKLEFITKMYGLPRYGNLDPTIFVVPFLILFIGMMVADVVTGIILAGIGYLFYKKYGQYSEAIKNLMTLVILCGLMAIIVGVSTGEYFGNLLHHYILGDMLHGHSMPGQIFDPKGPDLYLFLQFAILLGLFHLILGTLLGFYNELRQGKLKEGLTEYFGWSLFGAGLAVIFLSTKIDLLFISIDNPLSAAFNFGSTEVGRVFPTIFGEFGALGVLLIATGLILSFLKKKFMILIEFIDFFAFTLSYARITALLIAAGAVAAAFNELSALAWGAPIIGPLLGAVIFIIAHAVAMFLAILDGFVQSLRLVYVEHFSRYYEGGGREFVPFAPGRRYTK